ncbi:MAG: hypothetical protein FWD47_12550 [Treponema sp.]|nr:hypothetical protein [Treponema sp.]
MKKILLVFVLAAALAAGSAFADHPSNKVGIGAVAGWHGNWSNTGGFGHYGLALKLPSLPVFWIVNLGFNPDYFRLGLSGDVHLIEFPIVTEANLHFYFGVGGWVSFWTQNDITDLSLGVRTPVGISWHALPDLEVFFHIAPSLGIYFTDRGPGFPSGGWPVQVGFRYWF